MQEIPSEYSWIFIDRNQPQIMVIDQETGKRYLCDLHFGTEIIEDIHVGKGWDDYSRAKELKQGDSIFLVLFGDNPHNLHTTLLERA